MLYYSWNGKRRGFVYEKISIKIYSFDTSRKPSFCLSTTEGFRLVFVKEGSGAFRLNGSEIPYERGKILCVTCVDSLWCEKILTETKLIAVQFFFDVFSSRLLEIFDICDFPAAAQLGGTLSQTDMLFDMIAEEHEQKPSGAEIFIGNLVKEILVYMSREIYAKKSPKNHDIKTNFAILFVYENLREELSLESVAAHIHYSPSYFYHSFQKNTGSTFQKFVHELRLRLAATLLRDSDLSVTDICYECGFNSIQYFSTVFKKNYGVSPGIFKRNIKSHKENEDL